jgi:hypothetical protein
MLRMMSKSFHLGKRENTGTAREIQGDIIGDVVSI